MTGHQDTPDISINTETSFLSDLSFNRSKAGVLYDGGTLINEASGSLFFQHPVRWDISGEELTYLNKLFSNTVPTPPGHLWTGGCYLWCGSLDSDGYARHCPPKGISGSRLVHRFVYQQAIGPEPDDPMWAFTGKGDDITIHHECGNRACINLLHLQILPLKLNRELGDPKALYAI